MNPNAQPFRPKFLSNIQNEAKLENSKEEKTLFRNIFPIEFIKDKTKPIYQYQVESFKAINSCLMLAKDQFLQLFGTCIAVIKSNELCEVFCMKKLKVD